MQSEGGTFGLKDLPHFLQKLNITNDTSVIHVPLVVDWVESCDLVDQTVDATAKVQWAKWVTLLNPCTRLDDVLVIVK
jgi:hypothetical protein